MQLNQQNYLYYLFVYLVLMMMTICYFLQLTKMFKTEILSDVILLLELKTFALLDDKSMMVFPYVNVDIFNLIISRFKL